MYPNLRAEIKRKGLTESEFASEVLGITATGFSLKITGKNPFKQSEIEETLSYFNLPYKYIFARKE